METQALTNFPMCLLHLESYSLDGKDGSPQWQANHHLTIISPV